MKKKYNIDVEMLIGIVKEKGLPLSNPSRCGPNGYWFLVAAALSNRGKPSDNYVLAVYRCWNYKKDDVCQSFGKSHRCVVCMRIWFLQQLLY